MPEYIMTIQEETEIELAAYEGYASDRVSLPVAIAAASAAFPRFIAAVDLYRAQH